MMTNKQLLAIAIKQLGNNGTKYRKYVGMGGSWCDMFVYWLYDANGCGSLLTWKGKQRYYCPASIEWCKKNLAEIPLYLAMPCDIFYMDWDKNGVPNHIGIVEKKDSTGAIYTIEGNTNGGKVARKHREGKYNCGLFRPHFAPTGLKKGKLATDGDFGYHSIYMLQVALQLKPTGVLDKATVKKLQQKVGVFQDGAWGAKTSRAVQSKLCGFKGKAVDGAFGEKSVRALQQWINNKLYPNSKPTTTKPTNSTTNNKPTTIPATPKATLKSYRIAVDLTNQICTVYGIYSDGTSKPIMSEWVSTARKGCTTPVGAFKIQGASDGRKAKYRTAKMSGGKSYAEFLCRFTGAKCMHTVPYLKRNTKGLVSKTEFNKLGTPASSGCVRMPYKLAKFIYNTCPVGTPVIVFKGKKGEYPMGKPKKYKATSNVDPTK